MFVGLKLKTEPGLVVTRGSGSCEGFAVKATKSLVMHLKYYIGENGLILCVFSYQVSIVTYPIECDNMPRKWSP